MTYIVIGLIVLIGIQHYFYQESQAKWMRLFAAQQGVSIPIMEGRALDEKKTELKQDTRKRLSIPVPMGGMR